MVYVCFKKQKNVWDCIRFLLTLTSSKILSFDNKNKKSFYFVLFSLFRIFALNNLKRHGKETDKREIDRRNAMGISE